MLTNNSGFAMHRQSKLIGLLRRDHFLKVDQLAAQLGVSIITIRRDLAELAQKGLLQRTHGGALAIWQVTLEKENADRAIDNRAEKRRIGAAAAAMVVEGDTVLIDAGTTGTEVARALATRKGLTFITNSLDVADILGAGAQRRLFVIGGEFLALNHSFVGPMAADMVRRFNVDKAFLCVASISLERGLLGTLNPQLACVQQAMVEVARMSLVVADQSKFSRAALSVICALNRIECIVTDKRLGEQDVARTEAHGPRVLRV